MQISTDLSKIFVSVIRLEVNTIPERNDYMMTNETFYYPNQMLLPRELHEMVFLRRLIIFPEN